MEEPQPDENELLLKANVEKSEQMMRVVDELNQTIQNVDNKMNTLSHFILKLQKDVDEVKEPSDMERMEMRAQDSYPYNKQLKDIWDEEGNIVKQGNEEEKIKREPVFKNVNKPKEYKISTDQIPEINNTTIRDSFEKYK